MPAATMPGAALDGRPPASSATTRSVIRPGRAMQRHVPVRRRPAAPCGPRPSSRRNRGGRRPTCGEASGTVVFGRPPAPQDSRENKMRAGGETIDRAMPVRRGRQCSPVTQTMPPAWPGGPVSPGKRVEALRSVGRITGAAGPGNSLERRSPGTSEGGLPLPLLRRAIRRLAPEAAPERRLARLHEPCKGGGDDGVAAAPAGAEGSS